MKHRLSSVVALSAFFVVVGATFGGCAGPRIVNVKVAAVPPGPGREVVVLPVEDQRANKKKLAMIRSAVGIPATYKMETDKPVEVWVQEIAVAELNRAGFAARSAAAAEGHAMAVTVRIKSFYCDSYYSYQPHVTLQFDVTGAGKTVLSKAYEGKNAASGAFVQNAVGFRDALEMAATNATTDFVAELKNR